MYAPIDIVFLKRPSLRPSPAERMVPRNYSKLMPYQHSLCYIIRVEPDYLRIGPRGVWNIVNVNPNERHHNVCTYWNNQYVEKNQKSFKSTAERQLKHEKR